MQLPEDRLNEIEARFKEIESALVDPAVASRPDEIRSLGKEHSELKPIVEAWTTYRQARDDLREARAMLAGAAGAERTYLEEEIATQEETLERLGETIAEGLVQKDP
ncbi:MAG: PCRF domain-containing protein, partial [Actinomycetota bacterium]|nr:PCRF domain-containing protein [Actinomycetota bacterium]